MTRTLLILAALLASTANAGAQVPRVVRALERSYELDLGDIVFPTAAVGSVNVKPCSICPRVVHRVTPVTVYLLDDEQLSFTEFQKLLEVRRAASRPTYVGVHYSIDTNQVTRIRLN